MRKYIIASILFFAPIAFAEITEPKIKNFADQAKLDCESYGDESCSARFMALGACTYFISVNSGKSNKDALKLGDAMLVFMMKSHDIKPEFMFNKNKRIKDNIKKEFIERTFMCKSQIEEAIPIIYKKNNGDDIEPKLMERLVNAFPYWYLESLEKIFSEK